MFLAASLKGETSSVDAFPIESPAPFRHFLQHLINFDSAVELVHYFGESAKFKLQCSRSLRERIFLAFREHADEQPYDREHPLRIFRVDDSIYIQLRNITPIRQSIVQYMVENIVWYAQGHGPFAGQRFATWVEREAHAPGINCHVDYCFTSSRRAPNANANIFGETLYGTHLGGEAGGHQRMQRFLEDTAILASIVVDINHPWIFQDHDDNSVVLLYYERPPVVPPVPVSVVIEDAAVVPAPAPTPAPGPAPVVPGEPNGARPSFGIILGLQLTAGEITNLVNTTGMSPDFLYGHGRVQRPGGVPRGSDPVPSGRCWFDNPGDNDVYRFHIPARVLMLRESQHDDVIIGGVHVDFNDLSDTANMTINCKHMMQYVVNGVAAMPVPPGGNFIDLAPYGGQVNFDFVRGPLGDVAVLYGQPICGHNVGFLANAPGGTPLSINVAAMAAPEAFVQSE